MPTETLPTRSSTPAKKTASSSFVLAVALHAGVVGGLLGWALVSNLHSPHWGDKDPTAGSIQASMVNALPLPPRQRTVDNAVLASDKTSAAPTPPPPTPIPAKAAAPAPPKAAPPPRPDEILIPNHTKPTPRKTAERTQPQPASRVPPPPPSPKATSGETAGMQIPESITQLKNGTATVTVDERAFGDRYAYYIRLISQKINQSKSEQDPDPPQARGLRAAVRFTINRDGTPTDAQIVTRSGSSALDTSTLRAIQRIDTFGPLPAGDHITITFGFTDR